MENSKALFQRMIQQISLPESADEIRSIVFLVLENLFGLSREAVYAEKHLEVEVQQARRLTEIIERINQEEPVHYILGEADFFARKFKVNPSVLIPRPETEELVQCVLRSCKPPKVHPIRILDIGTGSGCIAVTLALELSGAAIYATDISSEALLVAKENAAQLGASVQFLQHSILAGDIPFHDLDVLVSNPPYIARAEVETMGKNVVAHEPHLALFVPDDDPLVFYRALAERAKPVLKEGGLLVVEINERLGNEVAALFEAEGYGPVEIISDLSGKARIVKGVAHPISHK